MSEFFGISTLDQQFLCFLVVLIVGAIAFGLWGYRFAESSYELGYSSGKTDLNREILRAENKAYLNGYEKAKREYEPKISPEKAKEIQAKICNALREHQAKTNISKPKTANISRKSPATTKKVAPKPAAKKPVKKAVKGGK